MEILRTLVTTGDGDSDNDRLNNWPSRMPAEGIWADVDMPVTVGGAGGVPAIADLVSALNHFLGIFNLTYKLGTEFRPYQGASGSHLRTVHRVMTLREVWNDCVGVAGQGAPGAHIWRARVYLTPHRQKAEGRRRLIGWTQGKTIEVTTQEQAGAFVAPVLVLSRTAGVNFNLRIIPAYVKGEDQFSHLPFYREVNRSALDVEGPDGTTLAFYDDNAPAATTAITNHSIKVGETELVRQVTPTLVREQYAKNIDAGGSNIDDTNTPLYMADPFDDERDLPAGPISFKMVAQDVATVMGRFIYWPTISEQDAHALVKAAAMESRSDVSGQLPDPGDDPGKNGAQASASIIFRRRDDQRFTSELGLVSDRDGTEVAPFVPREKQLAGETMKGVNPALLRRFQKLQELKMPGATRTNGKGYGTLRESIRGVFGHLF